MSTLINTPIPDFTLIQLFFLFVSILFDILNEQLIVMSSHSAHKYICFEEFYKNFVLAYLSYPEEAVATTSIRNHFTVPSSPSNQIHFAFFSMKLHAEQRCIFPTFCCSLFFLHLIQKRNGMDMEKLIKIKI